MLTGRHEDVRRGINYNYFGEWKIQSSKGSFCQREYIFNIAETVLGVSNRVVGDV